MKKLLLALTLLLFLAGGAGAAWWFLLRSAPADGAGEEIVAQADPAYLDMPQFAVPVIRADGSVRLFIFELSLEISDDEFVDPVTDLMPRLQDTVLVTLHELLARRFMEERDYDQELIKRHLVRVTQEVAGEQRISAVMIRNMEQRRRG